MPKKKITVGHSSKNGKKALLEKYVYCELTREQIHEIEKEHQETELHFPPSKTNDFEKTAYKVSALLGGNSQKLESIHKEEHDELIESIKKLYLLCDHYGIDPNDPNHFMLLSIELARELFPPPRKKGRKAKWTERIETILVIEMERLIKTQKTIDGAAEKLSQNQEWIDFIEERDATDAISDRAEVLRCQYTRCHKKSYIKKFRPEYEEMPPKKLKSWASLLLNAAHHK